jgi:hypothetical protein
MKRIKVKMTGARLSNLRPLLQPSLLLMAVVFFLISPLLNKSKATRQVLQQIQANSASTGTSIGTSTGTTTDIINYHGQQTSPYASLVQRLESSDIQYYVYDNPNMTLPHIRDKAMNDAKQTWTQRWGLRFADYSKGEIMWLLALEDHHLRTYNASEASFIVVPIPIGATFMWGYQADRTTAFSHLLENEVLFQQFPEKHILIANTEKLFATHWGLPVAQLEKLKSTTIVRDADQPGWMDYLRLHQLTWCTDPVSSNKATPEVKYFSHIVALGYSHEGALAKYEYEKVVYDSWKNKTNYFFYHTTTAPSVCNSTIFRSALVNDVNLSKGLMQPSSVGFDIPSEQWNRDFASSKFCLVIRGDNPASRSMYRGIRSGCMPVIISDTLPSYHPLYASLLKFEDFALVVTDEDFLKDPVGSLNAAVHRLSEGELRRKVEGLALLQSIIAADLPDSLFVPAFVSEVVAARQKEIL